MTKILQIGDAHFSDIAPAGRADDYQATCLRKLAEVVDYANQIHPEHVIFMGDIFHLKRPTSISHYLVNSINALLRHLPVRPYVVLGNHDTPTEGKALAYYPLASLYMNILFEPMQVGDLYLIPIAGSIAKSDDFIRSYVIDAVARAKGIPVVVAHLGISRTPLQFEYVPADLLAGLVPLVLFGHLHYRDIFMIDGTLFSNPGALLRTSMSETDFRLEPAVNVIDVKTLEVEVHNITADPPQSVMQLEIRADQKEKIFSRARFIDMLEHTSVALTGAEAIKESIRRADVRPPIKEVAIELIDFTN